MKVSVADLRQWRDSLSSMSSACCGFAHHPLDPDTPDAALCPKHIIDSRHGCAHKLNDIVRDVLWQLKNAGIIDNARYVQLFSGINTGEALKTLDFEKAFKVTEDDHFARVKADQQRLIDQRAATTAEMIEIIDQKLHAVGVTPLGIAV